MASSQVGDGYKIKVIVIADKDEGFDEIDRVYEEVMGELDNYASRIYYELMVADLLGLKLDEDTTYISEWSDIGWFSPVLKKVFDKPTYVMIYPFGKSSPLIVGYNIDLEPDLEIIDMKPNEERIKMYEGYLMGVRRGMDRLLKKIRSMNVVSFIRWMNKVI